jgi:hypothetical protein
MPARYKTSPEAGTGASIEKKDAVLVVQADPREEVHAQCATSRTKQAPGYALVARQPGAGVTASLAAAVKAERQVATSKSARQTNTNVPTYSPPPNTKATRGNKLRFLAFGSDRMTVFPNALFCINCSIVESYPPHKQGEKLAQKKCQRQENHVWNAVVKGRSATEYLCPPATARRTGDVVSNFRQ